MNKLSSALTLCLLAASSGAQASESDAREVFATAVSGAMSFAGDRAVDDISVSFLHYTSQGRAALINELERTGLLAQAVNYRAAVRAELPANTVVIRRRVGADGLEEYDASATLSLQWSKCDAKGCATTGQSKSARVTGTVVPVVLNGRPGYKVSKLQLEGATK